jgi:hypothetical protein
MYSSTFLDEKDPLFGLFRPKLFNQSDSESDNTINQGLRFGNVHGRKSTSRLLWRILEVLIFIKKVEIII